MVDSSVWIDFFNGRSTPQTTQLAGFMGAEWLLVGDVILCEILQGTRGEQHARMVEAALRKFDVVPMLNPQLAVAAAYNYRLLRQEGITIRKTIDLIIGTYCIAHRHALLYVDKDYKPMETFLGLRTVPQTWSVNEPPPLRYASGL